jgi:hypothetical protein
LERSRECDPAQVADERRNALPVEAESCDDSLIATDTTRSRTNLEDERFGSRGEWGAYINLTTALHRREVAQVDEFIALLRRRIEQAMRQNP